MKYPYFRGALLDLWWQAKADDQDSANSWKSFVENPESRRCWQRAREWRLAAHQLEHGVELIPASLIQRWRVMDGSELCVVDGFHHQRQVSYFDKYTRKFTDTPYLVELKKDDDGVVLLIVRSAGCSFDLPPR